MSAPVMSNAGRYGVSSATVLIGRLDDHDRVIRVERLDPLVAAHEAGRAHPVVPAKRIARLVDALPREQRIVTLERVDDLRRAAASRDDGGSPALTSGRSGRSPSHASSGARPPPRRRAPCARPRSARRRDSSSQPAMPVRTNVTPAPASSAKPSAPVGVFAPGAGATEMPMGKSVLPATLRPPLGSTTTLVTAAPFSLRHLRHGGNLCQRRRCETGQALLPRREHRPGAGRAHGAESVSMS